MCHPGLDLELRLHSDGGVFLSLARIVLCSFSFRLVGSLKTHPQWQVLWSFSIFLESVAILPQLFQLQRTGEAETITTHYMFFLGAYRGLYLLNWIWRFITEGYVDAIAETAGVLQTALYADFFYVYFTRVMKGKRFVLPA